MGDYWWIALGAVLLLGLLVVMLRAQRDPDACPDCEHHAGLEDGYCWESTDVSGLAGGPCRCQNDYHWTYVTP